MKKLLIIFVLLLFAAPCFAKVGVYGNPVPIVINKTRNDPVLMKLYDIDNSVFTEPQIDAITKVEVKYIPSSGADSESTDSVACADCFDTSTWAEWGEISIDLGPVAFTAGRDREAELIIYTAEYTAGRVVGKLDIKISEDAIRDATMIDPQTTMIALDELSDVDTTSATTGQVLAKQADNTYAFEDVEAAAGIGDMREADYATNGSGTRVDYAEVVSDGTNTKTAAQVAGHIDSTSNPHSVSASDAGAVATTGDETVAGVKTFSSSPIVPTPTTGTQAANRQFVVDQLASTSGTMNTVEEGGVQVGDSDISILNFIADVFNITEPVDGEVNIDLDESGIDHDSLSNFSADEHFLQSAISIPVSQLSNVNAGTDLTADGEEETHGTEHQSGGADAIKLDDLATPDDNTDLDVSILRHGLAPKLPNDSTLYLDGEGNYTAPSGTGGTGSAIIFDIGDDGGNDSTDLSEIATSGDTNNIFTEPIADKMLIDLGQNWPTADVAEAGDSATAFFDTGNIETARLPTDLTDAGDSALHYHATDRSRVNHTGTQTAATISDFDTEVSNNPAVTANTAKETNTDAQDLTLTGNTLAISGDPNTDVDLSPYLDNTDTTDHTAFLNLAWLSSGHTGPINSIAGFNGAGAAVEYYFGTGTGDILEGDTTPVDIGAEPADATILKDADIGVTVLAPNGDGSQLTGISATPEDFAFGTAWNGDADATSKNSLHDYFILFDSDADGVIDGAIVDNVTAPASSGDTSITAAQIKGGVLTDQNLTGAADFNLPDVDVGFTTYIRIVDGTYTISVCPPTGEFMMVDIAGTLTQLDANDEADLTSVEGDKFIITRRYSATAVGYIYDIEAARGGITDGGVGD